MKHWALIVNTAILALSAFALGANTSGLTSNQSEPEVEETQQVGGAIGSLPWNQSNIEKLRSLDKAAVVRFMNEWAGTEGDPDAIKANQISEFEWVNLADDGKYELATVGSQGPCCIFLYLYRQDALGEVTFQSYGGAGELSKTIRDLNGDGKKELILSQNVVENDADLNFFWPVVYRLEKSKYVEASRDFSKFYDQEVLPELDKEIAEYQRPDTHDPDRLAGLLMERFKILRVLGRDPTAGLKEAYGWMSSSDPNLLQDAAITFSEIGGHDADSRAADEARMQVVCRDSPRFPGCKKGGAASPSP
jgi:hypothetical protein